MSFLACFVNNVFEQTISEEINYSCNQIGCRVIETLLPFANDQVIIRYIDAFSSDLRPLCSERFASHVLQALVSISCLKSIQDDAENKKTYKEFTLKVSKFILNNLEDYVSDIYANHVIRTVFTSLSGLLVEDNKKSNIVVKEVDTPDEYQEIVKDFVTRLTSWPHFKDLPYEEITSGLLQVLLKALRKIDLKQLKGVQKKLLTGSYAVLDDETKLPQVFNSKPATMLLEMSLNVSTSKTFTLIYENCFKGHLTILSKKKENNISVQRLLSNCPEKNDVSMCQI